MRHLCCYLAFLIVFLQIPAFGNDRMAFWETQRLGANGFLFKPGPEWFEAAGKLGLEFVRLSPDRWESNERDFLIGDCDNFKKINSVDLAVLIEALDLATKNNVKIVLTMISLPGCRNKQLNNDKDDGRIWRDEKYHLQAFEFWRQLASAVKDHPSIVAYNPLNEPHPDREFGFGSVHDDGFKAWFDTIQGTPADLNRFNKRLVAAIREVDSETPIMIDGWEYASPGAFQYNQKLDDPNILYALHNPGPWHFAAFRINKKRFSYPDKMPTGWIGPTKEWKKTDLANLIKPVDEFAHQNSIPANRIIASEYWCDRRVGGVKAYLSDLINLYNSRGWHWSFYQYRSDGNWGGLDYELGTNPKLGYKFYRAIERGEDGEPFKKRHDNPLWRVISRNFQQK